MRTSSFSKKALWSLCIASAGLFSACSDSDNEDNRFVSDKTGPYFVSITGDSSEYIMQLENIDSGETNVKDNIKQLDQSGYTWIFSDNHKHAIGFIYNQGDPGIGLGYDVTSEGNFRLAGQFQIADRFTTYGFFDDKAIAAVGGQAIKDKEGREDGVTFNVVDLNNNLKKHSLTIETLDVFKKGEQATLSGIVDRGNGTFLSGAVVSGPRDPNAGGGASTGVISDPNRVYVAILDRDFKIVGHLEDDRISYSSGRMRSQYYSQIGIADDGAVYVFSGSYESTTTLPAGALKINKGSNEFDKAYYFNIEEALDGHKFRKVWHATGSLFLLEVYNEVTPEKPATATATQYAIADMNAKTIKWIKGEFPEKDQITQSGLPTTINGHLYFPITTAEASHIYIINPTDASVKKGIKINGVSKINAVGYLK